MATTGQTPRVGRRTRRAATRAVPAAQNGIAPVTPPGGIPGYDGTPPGDLQPQQPQTPPETPPQDQGTGEEPPVDDGFEAGPPQDEIPQPTE